MIDFDTAPMVWGLLWQIRRCADRQLETALMAWLVFSSQYCTRTLHALKLDAQFNGQSHWDW